MKYGKVGKGKRIPPLNAWRDGSRGGGTLKLMAPTQVLERLADLVK